MKRSKFNDEQILAIVRGKAQPGGKSPICVARRASPSRPTTAGTPSTGSKRLLPCHVGSHSTPPRRNPFDNPAPLQQ